MKLGVVFLAGLLSVNGLFEYRNKGHEFAQYDHIYQFDKSTSLNACETWSESNTSVPVHNFYGPNAKNTSCLNVNWDMATKTEKLSISVDLSPFPTLPWNEYTSTSYKPLATAQHRMERNSDFELFLYNKDNLPHRTMVITTGTNDDTKQTLASIDSVDATGKIEAVTIIQPGEPKDPSDSVYVKWWGAESQSGMPTMTVTRGEGAELELVVSDIRSDGKGTVTGIKIVNGGKNYQKTEKTFSPKTASSTDNDVFKKTQEVHGECHFTNKLGDKVTYAEYVADGETAEPGDCSLEKAGVLKGDSPCKCHYFGVRYSFERVTKKCNKLQIKFLNRFNGPFTAYAYTAPQSYKVVTYDEQIPLLAEGVLKDSHIPLDDTLKYKLAPKWKHDERNIRNKLTVNVTAQEGDTRWNCVEKYTNLPDEWGKYSCDKATNDLEVHPVEYLNKRAKGVKQVPFVTGLVPSTVLSIDKSSLPLVGFEEGAIGTVTCPPGKDYCTGGSCTVTRRLDKRKGVLKEVRVVYGGSGCEEAPMLRIKRSSTHSNYMNITLTVADGQVTTAKFDVTAIRESFDTSHHCKNDAKDDDKEETGKDTGGFCDLFQVSGPVIELYDFQEVESLHHNFGINADDSKDSSGNLNNEVKLKWTPHSDAIVSDHASADVTISSERELDIKITDPGRYWQKIGDIVVKSKNLAVTIKSGTGNFANNGRNDVPTMLITPVLKRNCDIPPQFEFVFEDEPTSGKSAFTEMQDATCEFRWKKKTCENGLTQNYTLTDVVFTGQGTHYAEFTEEDSKGVKTQYPYIQMLNTKASKNWWKEKLTVAVAANERAEISFKNTEGVMAATVDKAGSGYVVPKYGGFNLRFNMPTMTKHESVTDADKLTGKEMVRDVVVLEGGKGYKDYQQVCCAQAKTNAGITYKSISHLPNGQPIGTIAIDANGVVTEATLAPQSWMFCNAELTNHYYFVCGRTMKSIKYSVKNEKNSCGNKGFYKNPPEILFDVDKQFCTDTDFCVRPTITAILEENEVTKFTVDDGGWVKEVTSAMTNIDGSSTKRVLYDWGDLSDLVEDCKDDNGNAIANCNTSPRMHTDLKYTVEWEEAGVGAILALDYALETLNAVRGNGASAGGTYQKEYTTISYVNGEVTGLNLARTAYHTFPEASFPLRFLPHDKKFAAHTDPYKQDDSYGYYVHKEKRSADGSLKGDFTIRNTEKLNFKWDHDASATKHAADEGTNHLDNKLNDHVPWGFSLTIWDKDNHALNGYNKDKNAAGKSKDDFGRDNLFGKIKALGALTAPLEQDSTGTYNTYMAYPSALQITPQTSNFGMPKLIDIDENFTQSWTYETISVHSLSVKMDSPDNSKNFYYETRPKPSPLADRIPFETEANLFDVFTSFKVIFDVEDVVDITDSYANVTVYNYYQVNQDSSNKAQRYRVCPKHPLYESIHFKTEVYEGKGDVKVVYGPSRIHTDSWDNTYQPWSHEGTYVYPNRMFAPYTWTSEKSKNDEHEHTDSRFNSACIDVQVLFNEDCGYEHGDANYDSVLKVRLSAKITYPGGECIIDDDCVDRTNGGGATKASLAVRESVNSDINRFTYCYVADDVHAPTCRECNEETDCDGGQYCFDADKIINNLAHGEYYTSEMKAWAHKMINKHKTCQKKEGLGKSCAIGLKTHNSLGGTRDPTHLSTKYREKYTKNGDTTMCGGAIFDYDGDHLADQWTGFCESHVCVECTKHAKKGSLDEEVHLSGKMCVAGQLVNARLTGITSKNDYWDQAQKLSNENEAATKVAENKLTMLTDIMGVTLMFSILTAFSAFISSLLLMGRCNSCKVGSGQKVTPE